MLVGIAALPRDLVNFRLLVVSRAWATSMRFLISRFMNVSPAYFFILALR